METTFTLEPGDYNALQKLIRRRGSRLNLAILVAAIIGGFAVGFGPSIINGLKHPGHTPSSDVMIQVASVTIPLIIIIGFWAFVLRFLVKPLANNSLFSIPQTLGIKQEYLYWQQQGTRTTIQWTDIVDITDDTRSIYFFKSKNVAYIVPRRAFSNPNEADIFLRTATAYWKGKSIADAAKPGSGTWPPPPRIGA